VSERSNLDMGEAGGRRNDTPMDVVMGMATAETLTATGATIFEPLERNENGKHSRMSEAPATALAPRDWRQRIERATQQPVQELTQLHQTVRHLTNLLQAQAAREEAQWLGMRTWMQEREQKWDARHKDDKLWGAGITNMIGKGMKGVAPGQEAREKKETRLRAWMVGG